MHQLQAARVHAGLTQGALGCQVGCSAQMVGQIEAGKLKPGVPLALRLAAAVKVSATELFPDMAPQITSVINAVVVLLELQ